MIFWPYAKDIPGFLLNKTFWEASKIVRYPIKASEVLTRGNLSLRLCHLATYFYKDYSFTTSDIEDLTRGLMYY